MTLITPATWTCLCRTKVMAPHPRVVLRIMSPLLPMSRMSLMGSSRWVGNRHGVHKDCLCVCVCPKTRPICVWACFWILRCRSTGGCVWDCSFQLGRVLSCSSVTSAVLRPLPMLCWCLPPPASRRCTVLTEPHHACTFKRGQYSEMTQNMGFYLANPHSLTKFHSWAISKTILNVLDVIIMHHFLY